MLLCSHTKAAAKEAVKRWGVTGGVDIQTLHSFCFGQLGLTAAQTVTPPKMQGFAEEFGLDMEDGGEATKYVEVMSYSRSTGVPLEESYQRARGPGAWRHFRAFVGSYDEWKKSNGYWDFDDMLAGFLLKPVCPQYSMLAIDEAQDLTPAQWRVADHFLKLNPKCQLLIGLDDDQALYTYAGADPVVAHEFAAKHKAKVEILQQSYRVPPRIHSIAQQIAARMSNRVPKAYRPREGSDGMLAQMCGIDDLRIDPSRDSLVLYSDKFVRREVEASLQEKGIPYITMGGAPAPLQTPIGKAYALARRGGELNGNEIRTLRSALSDKGVAILDSVGVDAVLPAIRDLDRSVLRLTHFDHFDYLARVDLAGVPKVRIGTIHSSKGAEADDVHLVCEQSASAIEHSLQDADAQHRIMYVAVTRAREYLFLYDGNSNNYQVPY